MPRKARQLAEMRCAAALVEAFGHLADAIGHAGKAPGLARLLLVQQLLRCTIQALQTHAEAPNGAPVIGEGEHHE